MIDAISSLFSPSRTESSVVREPPRLTAAQSGAGFGAALTQAAADAVQTLKTAEATSMAGLEGKASAQKVVEAVLAAEQTLQTAVAIRDKLVNSYLEVTRMAI
jgi:flagellar hook-basal body complex protein FliE